MRSARARARAHVTKGPSLPRRRGRGGTGSILPASWGGMGRRIAPSPQARDGEWLCPPPQVGERWEGESLPPRRRGKDGEWASSPARGGGMSTQARGGLRGPIVPAHGGGTGGRIAPFPAGGGDMGRGSLPPPLAGEGWGGGEPTCPASYRRPAGGVRCSKKNSALSSSRSVLRQYLRWAGSSANATTLPAPTGTTVAHGVPAIR